MKKILSLILVAVMIAGGVIGADYVTKGKVLGWFKVETQTEYDHGDTLGFMEYTVVNNKANTLELNVNESGYVFRSGYGFEPDVLAAHAVTFRSTLNGALESNVNTYSFTLKCEDISAVYLTAGFSDEQKTVFKWYSTNGNIYEGASVKTATVTPDKDGIITIQALGGNLFRLSVKLDGYFANKYVARRNAFIALSYLGGDRVTISQMKASNETINPERPEGFKITSSEIEFKKNSATVNIASGKIVTNAEVTRVFVSSPVGFRELVIDCEKIYTDTSYYYVTTLKATNDAAMGVNENSAVTASVYLVASDGITYPVTSQTVELEAFKIVSAVVNYDEKHYAVKILNGEIVTNLPVTKIFINVDSLGVENLRYDYTTKKSSSGETLHVYTLKPIMNACATVFDSSGSAYCTIYATYNGMNYRADGQNVKHTSAWLETFY